MNYKELTGKKNPFEGLSLDEKRRLVVYFGYIAVPSVPMDEIKRRWGTVLKDDECPTAFEALEMVEIIKREVLAEENVEKEAFKKSGCFARFVFGLFCVSVGIAIGIAAFPYIQHNLQLCKTRVEKPQTQTPPPKPPPPKPTFTPKTGQTATLTIPGGEKMEMIYCGPGTFLMGSPVSESGRGDDETQHRVTLTKGFWLSKYKVTRAQWESIMCSKRSSTEESALPDLPIEGVSWNDCMIFVQKIDVELNCGVRMPTEAEWEYACRASSPKERAYSGDKNRWGFVDMDCGVLEWCYDIYQGDFSPESIVNPVKGKTYYGQSARRVIRGGDRWGSYSTWDNGYTTKYSTRRSRFADRLSAPSTVPYILYCEKYMGKEAGYADPGASNRFQPSHECYIGFRLCCSQLPSEQ